MKSLWHDPAERPDFLKRGVFVFSTWDGHKGIYEWSIPQDYPIPWEDIVARDRIVRWCYWDELMVAVVDILPESGCWNCEHRNKEKSTRERILCEHVKGTRPLNAWCCFYTKEDGK